MRAIRDTVPPEGIPTAYLSAVDLYFEYIDCKQGMVGVEMKEGVFRNSENIPLGSGIGKNKPDETLDELIYFHVKYPRLEGLGTEEKTTISALKEDPQESERDSINQTSNTCSVPPPVSPPMEKILHILFSSSFRNIIVGNAPETRKKTAKPENKGMKSLSQLCPNVFSIGYCEVSQRVASEKLPSYTISLTGHGSTIPIYPIDSNVDFINCSKNQESKLTAQGIDYSIINRLYRTRPTICTIKERYSKKSIEASTLAQCPKTTIRS